MGRLPSFLDSRRNDAEHRLNRQWWGKTQPLAKSQVEFKNRRKNRSRRDNEAEVFFAPKSASLRRRLPFLNSHWSKCGRICPGSLTHVRCGLVFGMKVSGLNRAFQASDASVLDSMGRFAP